MAERSKLKSIVIDWGATVILFVFYLWYRCTMFFVLTHEIEGFQKWSDVKHKPKIKTKKQKSRSENQVMIFGLLIFISQFFLKWYWILISIVALLILNVMVYEIWRIYKKIRKKD